MHPSHGVPISRKSGNASAGRGQDLQPRLYLELLGLELQVEAEGLDALREDHVLAGVLVLGIERVDLRVGGRLPVVVGAVGADHGQLDAAAAVAARPCDGGDLRVVYFRRWFCTLNL